MCSFYQFCENLHDRSLRSFPRKWWRSEVDDLEVALLHRAMVVSSRMLTIKMLPFLVLLRVSLLALLLVSLVVVTTVSGLSSSSSSKTTQYVLQPWRSTTAATLGQVDVTYLADRLKVETTTTTTTRANNNGDTTITTSTAAHSIQVPIPSETGSLASSLWPASCTAAAWWTTCATDLFGSSNQNNNNSSLLRILELGSGLGVTGWMTAVAAATAAPNNRQVQLVLTDQDDEAVARLKASNSYNTQQPSNLQQVHAERLDWRDDHRVFPKSNEEEDGNNENHRHRLKRRWFDVIVGSDVAYYHFLVGPLADTVQQFARKTNPAALLVLAAPASRQSFWELYHLLHDGGYNVKTDQYGDAWPGLTRMYLYKLYCETEKSTLSMAVLCWTSNADLVQRLQRLAPDLHHVATAEDEASMEMSF